MKFTQAIKMSIASILANRMRSFLTMLGIIIGISSVIILIGIGDGSKVAVTKAIQGMGTNLLTVNLTGSKAKSLTDDELSQIKTNAAISDIVPQISGSVTAKAGSKNYTTSVEASLPGYENIRDVHAALGRFITQDDSDNRYRVIDVGIELLQNIYPDMTADEYGTLLGTNIRLNGTDFEIIGILASKGTSSSGSSDNRVIMPLLTAERFLKNTSPKTYYVSAKTADDVQTASDYLNAYLLMKNSGDSSQFRVLSQSELLETSTQTTNNLTMMLAGIAAISLIVGGIGIMNIMLVSVIERTREIGIRKAIGAKRRDVLIQFLIEAVVLSCVGGLVGVGIGVLGCLILPHFMSYTITLNPKIMLLAFLFSFCVGAFFGLYPAAKASKLRPIDALSYE